MSSSLYGRPAPVDPVGDSLPDELKFIFRKRFGEPVKHIFTRDDLSYLGGLQDAGVEGAILLVQKIIQHEQYEVWEEY